MKRKIILKRIFHRGKWRCAIFFAFDDELTALARKVDSSTWSKTNQCWYADHNEETLKQIFKLFRGKADIDISSIASKDVAEGESPFDDEKEGRDNKVASPAPPTQGGNIYSESKPGDTYHPGTYGTYDPVKFRINERDGRLIIRFTGRYDQAWIKEMKLAGRIYYDKNRKEWLLPWSQLTVDSLSDYFSNRGVKVIVKKSLVPEVLQGRRDEQRSEINNRVIGERALEGIKRLKVSLEEKRYSKRTVEAYLSHIKLFFRYYSDRDPDDLDEQDISHFIDDYILKLGYSASYQNIVISAIKSYYSITSNRKVSTSALERPRRSRALPKVLSKEEVTKIFSSTRNIKHKLMLWLIYSCGLRRSEVINIRLTDLDRERGILHIREGKGNRDRMVPVSPKIWEKLSVYTKSYAPMKYLFEGQGGGKYSVESVYSVFKQSLRRAGINKDVGVHSLRHSYATHLHESGLDIRYIQELLGHKSSRTTEIYTHVSRRNLFAIRSPIEDMEIE